MNEDQISLLKDMLRSPGWQIFESKMREQIGNRRKMSTQQKVELEDRLWHAAYAQGIEDALTEPLQWLK